MEDLQPYSETSHVDVELEKSSKSSATEDSIATILSVDEESSTPSSSSVPTDNVNESSSSGSGSNAMPPIDDIKQQVNQAISAIISNPSQISNIVNQVKGNRDVMRQVLDYINKHPEIKDRATQQLIGSSPTMEELKRMSRKDRMEILQKAKNARKELCAIDNRDIDAIIINLSRKAKPTKISNFFPNGTDFAEGIVNELKDGICVCYNIRNGRVNRLATKIAGEEVRGEMVIFRDAGDGNLVNFTRVDYTKLFGHL